MRGWTEVAELKNIPVLGSRVIKTRDMDIALFRGYNDRVFALRDACPHGSEPLSQGVMHGHSVTCPRHNRDIDLASGKATETGRSSTRVFPVKIERGKVLLQLM